MKEPFYPAEWAIRIGNKPKEKPIHGNGDLLTKEARDYYSRRNAIEVTNENTTTTKTPGR